MSKNIIIGSNTLQNVTSIKVRDADSADTLDVFPDTSDATASNTDITQGKTAYVNGVKVIGTAAPQQPQQTKTVALSMGSGDQVITPDSGYVLSQVTVEKPSTLASENIKDGVTIGGETGTFTHIASNGATAGDILLGKKAYVNGAEVTGNIATKTSSDVTTSDNTVTVPSGYYASNVSKTVGTAKSADTYTPTSSDQTIASGQYLTGNQTIEGIVCANLASENIKDGVTVKIGTATDDDSVTTVVGSYQGGGGGGVTIGAGYTFGCSHQTGGRIGGLVLGQVDNGGSYGWHSFSWDGENGDYLIDGTTNYSDFINASLVVFTSVYFRYFDGGEVKLYDGTTINTSAGFSSAVGKICYLTQDTHIQWSD